MRDINFFSTYKVAKARSTDIALVSILVVAVLAGAAFAGIYFVNQSFAAIQSQIDQTNAYLASPEIVDKVATLQKERQQAGLLEQYLLELSTASKDIDAAKVVGTSLLTTVEGKLPATTQLTGLSVSSETVSLDCLSPVSTDAMDFLHALKSADIFAEVTLSGVTFDANGVSAFTLSCKLKGGVAP
jgi:Tfp pilus assembly protein PilN